MMQSDNFRIPGEVVNDTAVSINALVDKPDMWQRIYDCHKYLWEVVLILEFALMNMISEP